MENKTIFIDRKFYWINKKNLIELLFNVAHIDRKTKTGS